MWCHIKDEQLKVFYFSSQNLLFFAKYVLKSYVKSNMLLPLKYSNKQRSFILLLSVAKVLFFIVVSIFFLSNLVAESKNCVLPDTFIHKVHIKCLRRNESRVVRIDISFFKIIIICNK